jgi:hypothetical protein
MNEKFIKDFCKLLSKYTIFDKDAIEHAFNLVESYDDTIKTLYLAERFKCDLEMIALPINKVMYR